MGISDEDQEHLFSTFFRGRNVVNIQGTGLGLYLAKAIVDAHGGNIRVFSKPGLGSTFYFTIPL